MFNERYGLHHKKINSIIKDQEGIVWLGTENGLVKFDGLSFCDIIPEFNKYKSTEILTIKQKDNLLFLQYRIMGCLTYNLKTYEFKEIIKNNAICIEPINEREFFVIDKYGKLLKFVDGKSQLVFNFKRQFQHASISYFNNKLYLVLPTGLYKFNTTNYKLENKINNIKISYNSKLKTSYNYLHLINDNSVYVLDSIDNTNRNLKLKKLDIPEKVNYYIAESKNKYSYIYNYRKLVRGEIKSNDDIRVIHNLSTIDNIQLRNICIYDDYNTLIGTNQGLLWISRYQRGFQRIDDNFQFDTIVRVRRSMLQISNEELLLFGYPSIIKYNFKKKTSNTVFNHSTFYNSIQINDRFYITTNDLGLLSFDKEFKKIEYIHKPKDAARIYIGLCYDSLNNVLVAGGLDNLVFYNLSNHKKTVINYNIGLVKTIVKDNTNNLYWVGTKKGLYGIDLNGKMKYNITERTNLLKSQLIDISDLLITTNAEMWISHVSGIHKMNLKSIYSIEKIPIHNELINNSVALESDSNGRIWISTFQGIVIYDPNTRNTVRLIKDLQLINHEFNQSSSLQLLNGSFIFGGINGYDIINPINIDLKLLNHQPEISSIFKISNDDTIQCSVDKNNSIELKIGEEYLKIYVHFKNVIYDFYYNYEYSLDDNLWIKANPITQILITDLIPGKHKLRIRSLEKINNPNVIELNIIATLPFYKTNLFAWIISLICLSVLILYIYSLSRIKLVKIKLKNQIAMDLHDEVGTVLTKALFHSRKLNDYQLANLIENALNSLRAYIYSISNKRVVLIDLIDDVSEMLNFVIIDEEVKVKFHHADFSGISISSILYRDLKLSFFEIFANIQKHSHCTELEVIIEDRKNSLCIKFNDNGVFNDINALKKNGNGIENITKRISRHKGEIEFKVNAIGSGLSIDIKVPYKS